jgi:hypothetical protein
VRRGWYAGVVRAGVVRAGVVRAGVVRAGASVGRLVAGTRALREVRGWIAIAPGHGKGTGRAAA